MLFWLLFCLQINKITFNVAAMPLGWCLHSRFLRMLSDIAIHIIPPISGTRILREFSHRPVKIDYPFSASPIEKVMEKL